MYGWVTSWFWNPEIRVFCSRDTIHAQWFFSIFIPWESICCKQFQWLVYHILLVCYSLANLSFQTAGPQQWQNPKVAITHSNEVPWYLSSLPPDTPSLPVLIYKHLCIFSTTLPRLGEAPLCDEIIRETVTFPVVRLRVSTAWKNTLCSSGALLCQGARNAAEGCSLGPKAASKEWSEMWKRINNHSSK